MSDDSHEQENGRFPQGERPFQHVGRVCVEKKRRFFLDRPSPPGIVVPAELFPMWQVNSDEMASPSFLCPLPV
ncbi:MAG TPA: hypothetical protein VFY07_04815, partial [Geomobilimonas sp.]|nr:hypothetical protein [Geomobilimonas sp.]